MNTREDLSAFRFKNVFGTWLSEPQDHLLMRKMDILRLLIGILWERPRSGQSVNEAPGATAQLLQQPKAEPAARLDRDCFLGQWYFCCDLSKYMNVRHSMYSGISAARVRVV